MENGAFFGGEGVYGFFGGRMESEGQTWLLEEKHGYFGENMAFRGGNTGLRRKTWLFGGNTRFARET